jgi:hypothetical protein
MLGTNALAYYENLVNYSRKKFYNIVSRGVYDEIIKDS